MPRKDIEVNQKAAIIHKKASCINVKDIVNWNIITRAFAALDGIPTRNCKRCNK